MIGPDHEPRHDYDPEFAAGGDETVGVAVEDDTETTHMKELWISAKKYWIFKEIHENIKERVYLNIVESGKRIGNKIQYYHLERVILLVDDISQLVYPCEVPMYNW